MTPWNEIALIGLVVLISPKICGFALAAPHEEKTEIRCVPISHAVAVSHVTVEVQPSPTRLFKLGIFCGRKVSICANDHERISTRIERHTGGIWTVRESEIEIGWQGEGQLRAACSIDHVISGGQPIVLNVRLTLKVTAGHIVLFNRRPRNDADVGPHLLCQNSRWFLVNVVALVTCCAIPSATC